MIRFKSALFADRHPQARPAAVADHAPAERPVGCGWFDSSHELRTGLQIREYLAADWQWLEQPAEPALDLDQRW